jgi:dihydroorotate dehydrogenase
MPEKTLGVSSLPFEDIARVSMAYSLGMPSPSPVKWQTDFKKAKDLLQPGQVLNLSIVGTVDHVKDDLIDDFVRCAHLASEVGPHAIELNFSCPNVYDKEEGSIYRNPDVASRIVTRIRHELKGANIVAKIGYLRPEKLAEFFKATYRHLDGYTAINIMPVDIVSEKDEQVFPSNNNRRKKAGISGTAIRLHALATVKELRRLGKTQKPELVIFATGGVSSAGHVKAFLEAGANVVQICTAAMLNPHISVEIRRDLAGEKAAVNTSKYLRETTLNIRFSDAEIGLAFDRLLEACDEMRVPLDKGVSILQKRWLSEYAATVSHIESGSTEIAATRRAAPMKGQIISWIRNDSVR